METAEYLQGHFVYVASDDVIMQFGQQWLGVNDHCLAYSDYTNTTSG
jgi:hypothetical protein